MSTPEKFDAVVIGSGKAGKTLAMTLGHAGKTVALVERRLIGGSCINIACIPTKSMVASAKVAHLCREAAKYGVHLDNVRVDMAAVRGRTQGIVDGMRSANLHGFEATPNLDFILGVARFTGPKLLEVALNAGGTRTITSDLIFINTGARPAEPRTPGVGDVPVLNSTTIQDLTTVPEHLLVVGGSYIGLEFGQMFRRFGSKVTVIERGPQLLAREDADVSRTLLEILKEEGLTVHLSTEILKVQRGPNGEPNLLVRTPEGDDILTGSHLLFAVGRVPCTEELNLTAAGIHTDERGFIPVNDALETNVSGVYALGDVNGGPQFTHVSLDDFRVVRANLLGDGTGTKARRMVPYTLFTDPELGRIGLTEKEARAQGRLIKIATLPMTQVPRARTLGETRGFMKAVIDAETDQILGASILAAEGGEIMTVLQMAMIGKVPYQVVRETIFTHPTLAEGLYLLFQNVKE